LRAVPEAEGAAAEVVEGVPTSGAIPSGARVEREVPFVFNDLHSIRLALRNPDFTTAERIEDGDQLRLRRPGLADARFGHVLLDVRATREPTPAHAIGRIENLTVQPQVLARVVVDQRSGTIVLGEDVRISGRGVARRSVLASRSDRRSSSRTPSRRARPWWCPAPSPRSGEEPGAGS
jgi:flagellar P-ring protein FlgI